MLIDRDTFGKPRKPILGDDYYKLLGIIRFYPKITWREIRTEILRHPDINLHFTEDSILAAKNIFETKGIIKRTDDDIETYSVTEYGHKVYADDHVCRAHIDFDKEEEKSLRRTTIAANKSTTTTNNTLKILSILTLGITFITLAVTILQTCSTQKIMIIDKESEGLTQQENTLPQPIAPLEQILTDTVQQKDSTPVLNDSI